MESNDARGAESGVKKVNRDFVQCVLLLWLPIEEFINRNIYFDCCFSRVATKSRKSGIQ